MVPPVNFRSNEGRQALETIIKKRIPQWTSGLRDFQQDSIPIILDNQDLFAITATGNGKSALFAVPILVHLEISENMDLYPKFSSPIRKKPVGIVVTPTKGLANNIVDELNIQFGISGFAYTEENISQIRKEHRDIVQELIDCKYQIVCVDPEHLRNPEWMRITDSQPFRSNVIFGCVEEAHVIDEWGLNFRPLFRLVGSFIRGRLPSLLSIFAITATMEPGAPFDSVCSTLGFSGPKFNLIRQSNECPNVEISVKTLSSALGGQEFPELIPYLNQCRKTIIHIRTLELGYRVFLYLFKNAPKSYNRHHRIRIYSSLAPDGYNQRTVELLKHDPQCQIVIATKAFSLGIHAETLLDSISVGTADTQCELDQNGGRVGRIRTQNARRIIFTTSTEIKKAKKFIEESTYMNINYSEAGSTSSKTTLDFAKARFLTETICRVSCANRIYTNPPIDISYLDCIEARRRLPCDLCQRRYHIPSDPRLFPPSHDHNILPSIKDRAGVNETRVRRT
ncbi:P-loop containing nucleoside triphosphate hydrolase protein [Dendrothele bispora CBS 962.96]|uniref:DNA 3'-5' helicase n=1 Tax=Dendrothele bispora (strain CBS 962.96) TaxID=1314807 RepID=A0A4S8MG34_DENBC|nr:P-loop containing nucleoside triphosphate hydrolase protein [Dendrothele bispora CBS 962.96]